MITILYRCACMQDHGSFEVREREEHEDVRHWMDDAVRPALTADHSNRNALCLSRVVDEIKIPVDKDVPIGTKKETP